MVLPVALLVAQGIGLCGTGQPFSFQQHVDRFAILEVDIDIDVFAGHLLWNHKEGVITVVVRNY